MAKDVFRGIGVQKRDDGKAPVEMNQYIHGHKVGLTPSLPCRKHAELVKLRPAARALTVSGFVIILGVSLKGRQEHPK